MAKFRFELEAVLKQRLAIERQKQLALGELERFRLNLEDRLRGFHQSILSEKQDLRSALAPGGSIDASGVRMQANMSLHFVSKAQQTVYQLAVVHRKLVIARNDLLAAATSRKAVEKLKERRYEAWLASEARKEAATLDEISVMGFAARQEQA
ncbi:MAG: flagellar FliJ family protein [Phycisphaeraceae bacterium]|nr:flagellar FliJ family protein [Phycisphaeraceae bacterium]